MTNKQLLLSEILAYEAKQEGFTEDVISTAFDIINQRDYIKFCSQMADDGDHPQERVEADRAFEKKKEATGFSKQIDAIDDLLNGSPDLTAFKNFYHARFHDLYSTFEIRKTNSLDSCYKNIMAWGLLYLEDWNKVMGMKKSHTGEPSFFLEPLVSGGFVHMVFADDTRTKVLQFISNVDGLYKAQMMTEYMNGFKKNCEPWHYQEVGA